ncbi:MAG: hypothetical protein U1E65_08270 [Myxococcota bacterium]
MPTPTEIIRKLPAARFAALIAACPKNFREDLFRRAGVRTKTNTFALSAAPKTQVRAEKLHEAINGGLDLGDDVLEEVIRNYLYTRRPMLAEALDHFEVPHENGLTDQDISFIETLPTEKKDALRTRLEGKYDRDDVALYLQFMKIEG